MIVLEVRRPVPRLVKPYLEEMHENELDEEGQRVGKETCCPHFNAKLEVGGEGKENDEDYSARLGR